MTWDPTQYLQFADERTRPALDLLARVQLAEPRRALDLGCGPGNSTRILAARWPEADITGVDTSEEMIASARASGVRAHFRIADFDGVGERELDLIFSNAALHWSPDPVSLVRKLFAQLSPGGVLAFQIPQNFDQPSHTIAHELAQTFGVATPFDPARFPRARDFARALAGARLDVWTTEYLHVLSGTEPVFEWVSGSALRPILAALDETARAQFSAEVKRRYAEAYPREANGATLFPFRRLFVVAGRR
jgi:trans-aconitate 2-methyltransferase